MYYKFSEHATGYLTVECAQKKLLPTCCLLNNCSRKLKSGNSCSLPEWPLTRTEHVEHISCAKRVRISLNERWVLSACIPKGGILVGLAHTCVGVLALVRATGKRDGQREREAVVLSGCKLWSRGWLTHCSTCKRVCCVRVCLCVCVSVCARTTSSLLILFGVSLLTSFPRTPPQPLAVHFKLVSSCTGSKQYLRGITGYDASETKESKWKISVSRKR